MPTNNPLNPALMGCAVACTGWVVLIFHSLITGRLIQRFVGKAFQVEINRRGKITTEGLSEAKVGTVMMVYTLLYWGLFLLLFFGIAVVSIGIFSSYLETQASG